MLVRVDRRSLFEVSAPTHRLRIGAIDGVDPHQAEVFLALFRASRLPFDHVAAAQLVATNLRLADIDIFVADDVARAPEKAVSLGKDVEDSACGFDSRPRRLRGENLRDQLVLLDLGRCEHLDVKLFCNLHEIGLRLLFELRRREHRRHLDLWKRLAELLRWTAKVTPARTVTATCAALRAIVIVALFQSVRILR